MRNLILILVIVATTTLQAQPKFILGSDLSEMKKAQDSGVVYRVDGKKMAGLKIHKRHGIEWVRLRLFHNPNGDGPVCNSLDYTINFAKQVKKHKQKLLLDFHYSDTWADPGKQFIPAAWQGVSADVMRDSLYSYTKMVLAKMKFEGVKPDMIQVGNEISNGMLWDTGKLTKDTLSWSRFCDFIKAGMKASREECPGVPLMVHYDNGGSKAKCQWFYDNIKKNGVEYDYIGVSYYPFWHGGFDDLRANLENLSRRYAKDIIVVETGFDYKEPQMQRVKMDSLFMTVSDLDRVKGVIYWGGSWIGGDKWGTSKTYRSAMFDNETGDALPVFKSFLDESRRRKK